MSERVREGQVLSDVEPDVIPAVGQIEGEDLGVVSYFLDIEESRVEGFLSTVELFEREDAKQDDGD